MDIGINLNHDHANTYFVRAVKAVVHAGCSPGKELLQMDKYLREIGTDRDRQTDSDRQSNLGLSLSESQSGRQTPGRRRHWQTDQ